MPGAPRAVAGGRGPRDPSTDAAQAETWRRRAERERTIRLEAERIAEEATRRLYDVNQSLEAERGTLRAVLENAPHLACLLDKDGVVEFANRSVAGQGPVKGKAFLDLIPGSHRAAAGRAVEACLAHGTAERFEAPWPEPEGAWVEVHVGPVERGPERRAAVVLVMDVTERRRAAERERQAALQAQELEHMREQDEFKTRFINTAAHELNTPLTPIQIQLRLLRGAIGPEPPRVQGQALDVLDRNVRRFGGLVADLLTAARYQGGKLAVHRVPVDLSTLVRQAAKAYAASAEEAGVALEATVPDGLAVEGDRDRLAQVLDNLISNALKFTKHGGRIDVKARRRGKAMEVAVVDTGIGLKQEQIDRLFQPFTQVHEPGATTHQGTGLGLYVSRAIVELHGGEIRAQSEGPGKGTRFAFTVPAGKAATAEA